MIYMKRPRTRGLFFRLSETSRFAIALIILINSVVASFINAVRQRVYTLYGMQLISSGKKKFSYIYDEIDFVIQTTVT